MRYGFREESSEILGMERSSFGRHVKRMQSCQREGNTSLVARCLPGRGSGQISTEPTTPRERSLSILRSTPADSRSRGPIDFRPWKIAAGLLLAALLAACVCGIVLANYRSQPLTAWPSMQETKRVKKVPSTSNLQALSALRNPRLLPIQIEPDPVVTPGEAQNISLAEVKKRGSRGAQLSNIQPSVKRAVFLAYGLNLDEKNYELDYLIPLSLGGSNSAKNLWPHSRKGSFWTIDKKLTLEKRVYRLVCAGRLSLVSARQLNGVGLAQCLPKIRRQNCPHPP